MSNGASMRSVCHALQWKWTSAASARNTRRIGWRPFASSTGLSMFLSTLAAVFAAPGSCKIDAAGRGAPLCLGHALEHFLDTLGGDVRAAGPQQDGAPWRIGI